MTNGNLTDAERQALLAEYQVCQREASDAVTSSWQSGVIFFVTTLALAGTVVSGFLNTQSSPYRLVLIIMLGVFSIIFLLTWKRYLARQHFIRKVMFYRMKTIEEKLPLRKSSYVYFLDGTTPGSILLSESEQKDLKKEFGSDVGRKPKGFNLTVKVVRLAIAAWAILVIFELLIWFCLSVRIFLLN